MEYRSYKQNRVQNLINLGIKLTGWLQAIGSFRKVLEAAHQGHSSTWKMWSDITVCINIKLNKQYLKHFSNLLIDLS
jgi:hypothetical protein